MKAAVTSRRRWMQGVGAALAALVGLRAEASGAAQGEAPPTPPHAPRAGASAARGGRAGGSASPTARCGAGEAERL